MPRKKKKPRPPGLDMGDAEMDALIRMMIARIGRLRVVGDLAARLAPWNEPPDEPPAPEFVSRQLLDAVLAQLIPHFDRLELIQLLAVDLGESECLDEDENDAFRRLRGWARAVTESRAVPREIENWGLDYPKGARPGGIPEGPPA